MRSGIKIYFLIALFILNISLISILENLYKDSPSNDFKVSAQLNRVSFSNKATFSQSYFDINAYIPDLSELKITQLLNELTLEEKVGQLFIWKAQGKEMTTEFREFLSTVKPGGVILMTDNISNDLSIFTKEIQNTSAKIPLFISIDQEGGEVKRITSDPNPGAQALSKLDEISLCSSIKNTSNILASNNINLNFGIVADINWFNDSFISSRSFGSSPDFVSTKVGQSVICTEKIFSTVKHFPGHGRTKADSHITLPQINISYNEWLNTDALPFINSIEKGVDFIMTGHLVYTQIDSQSPASLSKTHIQNLRNFGFEGIIITDDMGMLEKSRLDPYQALEGALKAGNDVLLYVGSQEDFIDLYSHALNLARRGDIESKRVDESVKRILRKKIELLNE